MNTEIKENKRNYKSPILEIIVVNDTSIIVNSNGQNGDTLSSDNGWNI